MQYFGGKAEIANKLAPFLQSRLKPGQPFVDLFCGSANVVSRISAPVRLANDVHKSLIMLHQAVQEGWDPPSSVSEEEYKQAKTLPDCALKGFVGHAASFSGKHFGGYARSNQGQDYVGGVETQPAQEAQDLDRCPVLVYGLCGGSDSGRGLGLLRHSVQRHDRIWVQV